MVEMKDDYLEWWTVLTLAALRVLRKGFWTVERLDRNTAEMKVGLWDPLMVEQ